MARSSTQTFAFTTHLAAGREHEYEQFHRSIPAALDHAMREAGVVGWRIHRDGTTLTHVVEARDRARMEAQLSVDPVNLAWQEQVARFLAPGPVPAPTESSTVGAGTLIWDFSWPTRTTPERHHLGHDLQRRPCRAVPEPVLDVLPSVNAMVRLGRSAVGVSRLALGTAGLGNLYSPLDDDEARATVDAAWAVGMRYFDTAAHYGLGLSERRLGAALRDRPRDSYALSTKVGRLLEPIADDDAGGAGGLDPEGFAVPATHRRVWDFSASGIRRAIEASLERLGLDRIDIVYLHDPDDHAEAAFATGYPELERLRTEGVVGAIGAGMNQSEMLTRFVRDTDVDVVLLAGRYTLLDQTALRDLLPAAARHGVSVVIGGVFNSGLLADPGPGARFDYAAAPEQMLARAMRMKTVCERHGTPLRAAALQFPFGHPAVASVLVGARSVQESVDAAVLARHPIPGELWAELKAEGLLDDDIPVPLPIPAGE